MAYKDILVVTDESPQCTERVNVAMRLAARHEAHVIGLMVHHHVAEATYVDMNLPADVLDIQRRAVEDARARVREKFERQLAPSGLPFEWHWEDADPVRTVALYGRHADVAVIGQDDPESDGIGTSSELAEHVVLTSGRPVLVVPYVGSYPAIGEQVLIAWDASREAARAVADAMAILQGAKRVVVFAANPDAGGSRGTHGEIPGADIARHLARHDVHVDVQRVDSDEVAIADLLLNRIADEGIDTLVMGAYGHSRIRELWLGGVTRRVMRNMTVPVLTSH